MAVSDEILLDLIMPDLEELEEKAVRKLFNSLDKRKRGKLDDTMIGDLLKQLGQWTMVLPQKVQATRIEINDGDEDETVVELDQFLESLGHSKNKRFQGKCIQHVSNPKKSMLNLSACHRNF